MRARAAKAKATTTRVSVEGRRRRQRGQWQQRQEWWAMKRVSPPDAGNGKGINKEKRIDRHSRIGHRRMREAISYTQLQAAVRSDLRLPRYRVLHTFDLRGGSADGVVICGRPARGRFKKKKKKSLSRKWPRPEIGIIILKTGSSSLKQ